MDELRFQLCFSCRRAGFLALLLLLLLTCAPPVHGSSFVLQTFDSNIDNWYGYVSTLTYDGTQDNTGNGGGSCYAANSNQFVLFVGTYGSSSGGTWGTHVLLNLSDYKQAEFDVKWDNQSSITLADFNQPPAGEAVINIYSYKTNNTPSGLVGSFSIPAAATNGWVHVIVPISQTATDMDPSQGLWFQKWIGLGGTANFWLDNVRLATWPCSLPPPVLSLTKAEAGLNLFAGSGNPYDRENIRTLAAFGGQSWVGLGKVGYSFTVTRCETSTSTGLPYQIHLFLVPNAGNSTAPDWNDPDVLEALLLPQPDGSAVWTVQVKTNCSGSCPWPVYGSITNASPLGTWSLIFENGTNLTLVTPSGSQIQFTLPLEVVNRFADAPLTVYVGYMSAFTGPVVISQVQFTQNDSPVFQDDFSTGLDTNVWEVKAAYPSSIQPVPANAYWLNWVAPLSCDTRQNFMLATNSNLADPGGWGTKQLPDPVQLGSMKYVLLTTNTAFSDKPVDLLGQNSLFFRLQQ